MPMLQRFAAGRKVFRLDVPISPQTPTGRRGFLATAAACLGLAARPAVADEWVVEPDGPGPLLHAWRELQQAQANFDALTVRSDDTLTEFNGRINAAVAELVGAIAAAAGFNLAGLDREYDPGTAHEVPGLAAVREGSHLFALVYSTGSNNATVGGGGDNCAIQPAVFLGFFAGADPVPPPQSRRAPSKVDGRLVSMLDRYLAARDAHAAATLVFNAWDGEGDPLPADAEARFDDTEACFERSRRLLIAYMIGLAPTGPPMPCGSYDDSTPLYSQRIGDRLVIVKALGGDGWTRTDPDDIAFERLELVVAAVV